MNHRRHAGHKTHDRFDVDLGGGVKLELVWVGPGEFVMGANDYPGEGPAHRVAITKGFWFGKYEVTQAQWTAVMGSNPSHWKGPDLPVDQVEWEDCQEFVRRLNGKRLARGLEFRLPTEAEWEYGCRAGSASVYCYGNGYRRLEKYAWYYENSGGKTHPVGQKKPNAWGLFDMHGNVWEWCQDWKAGYPNRMLVDPTGPSSGDYRVIRGGSWGSNEMSCRAAARRNYGYGYESCSRGFRLAAGLRNARGKDNREP